MRIENIIKTVALSVALLAGGCNSFLKVNPDDTLMEENSYKGKNEVFANFLGMCSTLGEGAERALLVAELRGDLMMPTSNAPVEFWDVWRYEAGDGDEEVDPAPFYKVVVNANDFIRHARVYYREHPESLDEHVYKGMIGVALANRAWAYLNIGKFYGEAVYYDWALGSEIDLSRQRVLKFDQLVDELIYSLNNGVDGIDAFTSLNMADITGVNQETYNYMYVNAGAVLSELYMWDGDYVNASRKLVSTLVDKKVALDNFLTANWMTMWTQTYGVASEAISAIPYDYEKNQTNRLQYYFSNIPPNVYYFKPSDTLVTHYENTELNSRNTGDMYRGKGITYTEVNRETVINKYTLGGRAQAPYRHDSPIYLYRGGDLWLMLAESLNALGDVAAADSVLNAGLRTSYVNNRWKAPFDSPIYAAGDNLLKDCRGVRGRINAKAKHASDFVSEDASLSRKQYVLDSLIAEEVALECAFEGKRWFTLMRMARNSGQPGKLADQICKKFPEGEREQYRQYLMNPDNWFIKYDQLNVKED